MVIGVADLAGGTGVNLQDEIQRKMSKNAKRPKLRGKAF